ncbi:MAG: VirB3 family type IV secretion system protein [Pseudomonadota bacterium]|nr:VirB3 family type IV secretion system protein [Pseudomonadota bacterium]
MTGYVPRQTRVHKSLLEIQTLAGVERRLAIFNWTLAAVFVLGAGMVSYLAVAFILHAFLRWITRKDPYLRLIYIRYNRQADEYDPWPHATQKQNRRPHGFGRGHLC